MTDEKNEDVAKGIRGEDAARQAEAYSEAPAFLRPPAKDEALHLFDRHPLPWVMDPLAKVCRDARGKEIAEVETLDDQLAIMACANAVTPLYRALVRLREILNSPVYERRIALACVEEEIGRADLVLPFPIRRPPLEALAVRRDLERGE